MKVALIATDIPDHGIEFAEMMAASCDVLLCIPDKYFSAARPKPSPRLNVWWVPWPRHRDLRNLISIQKLSKLVLEWNPDIIHFLNENNIWNWVIASLLKGKPILTTVHDIAHHPGDFNSSRVPRFFANALIRKSTAIIIHGEELRAEAARTLPISPDKIFVSALVSPQFPSEVLENRQNRDNPRKGDRLFRVLFFGRIQEYKGLNYLLDSIPLVSNRVPNIRFIVAGAGKIPDHAVLSEYSCSIDIRNRFIPRAEVEQLLGEADLVALPYIEASQSGPLMMAIAFGIPVVATDVGAIPAVVRSTGMGFVVPSRDETSLAAAIIKIALDEVLHARLCANAKIAAKGDFSRTRISNQVISVYQQLL
jgi:glycosyltransferase involved in cell wall biosynthesis